MSKEPIDPRLIALAMLAHGALTGDAELRFFDRLPRVFRDRINSMAAEPSAAAVSALIRKIGPIETMKALDHFEAQWVKVPQPLRDALRPLVRDKLQAILGDAVEVKFVDKRVI